MGKKLSPRGSTGIKFAGGTQHLGWAPPMVGSPGEPHPQPARSPGEGRWTGRKIEAPRKRK
jgi:hypothetical protein